MTGPTNIATILAESRLFRALPEHLRRTLAAASVLRRVDPLDDDSLFHNDDPASEIFLVVSAVDGVGPVLQVQIGESGGGGFGLVEGELAGDVELLRAGLSPKLGKRISSARVLRKSVLLAIRAEALAEVAAADPELRRRLISQAAERLIGLTVSQTQRQALDPQVRFARGMLSLLDDYGRVVGNKGVYERRLSQDELRQHFGQSLRWVSQYVSDWSARGLIETVPIALPDVGRVELIAGMTEPGLAAKIEEALEDLERLISSALLIKAGQTAADLLSLFPGNPVAAYYLALASARSGAEEQAKSVLSQAGLEWNGSIADLKHRVKAAWRTSFSLPAGDDDGGDDADGLDAVLARRLTSLCIDIGALHARLEKSRIEAAKDDWEARQIAARAARLYREVCDGSPNHYCAVNAATLFRIAGDTAQASEMAGLAFRLASKDEGYWAKASMAEARLLQNETEAADALFKAAASEADAGRISSTRRQLQLLGKLTDIDITEPISTLNPGHALCFSGHIMRATDGSRDELARAEALLVERFRAWLGLHKIASVHMSLAAGADIIFAEQVIAAGIPLHVSLPFSTAEFCSASVEIGNGGHTDWVKRFYACLDRAVGLTEIWRHPVKRADAEPHFASANRRLMGETLKQADLLATQPMMLAAIGASAAEQKSFAAKTLHDFGSRGIVVETVEWPLQRTSSAKADLQPFEPFCPVVFAFARSTEHNIAAQTLFEDAGLTLRTLKDKRVAGHFVAGNIDEAIARAYTIASGAQGAATVRAICDYGPVRGRSGKVAFEELLKLEAAPDLKPLTLGTSFATSAFAMEAIARGAEPNVFSPMSVGEGDGTLRGARQVYLLRANRSG